MIGLFLTIIIVGVILGLVNRYIPMAPAVLTILNFLVVVLLVLYILQFFGFMEPMNSIKEFFNKILARS